MAGGLLEDSTHLWTSWTCIQCHHLSLDTADAESALRSSSDGTLHIFRWSTLATGSFAVNLKSEKDDKLRAKEMIGISHFCV